MIYYLIKVYFITLNMSIYQIMCVSFIEAPLLMDIQPGYPYKRSNIVERILRSSWIQILSGVKYRIVLKKISYMPIQLFHSLLLSV